MAVRKDNGQGSMYFDEGKGYWYAEIQWKDSSGTKKRKKFSGKSKTAVKKKLVEFKKQFYFLVLMLVRKQSFFRILLRTG